MRTINILSIPILAESSDIVTKQISNLLRSNSTHHIATVNPEILLMAHNDRSYADILTQTTYNTVDGFGIQLVARLKGLTLSPSARLTGVDLTARLLREANDGGYTVAIVLPDNALTKRDHLTDYLHEEYPSLEFTVTYESDHDFNQLSLHADIVFVAFGAPRQEQWIHSHMHQLEFAKIAIGIGGTFDLISGTIQRAPRLLRKLGLEWLWRLIREPKRIKRIVNAVILFPIIALTHE